jgi:hypothetical protein
MSSQYVVPEPTTEYNYPSGRKKKVDHKGNVVYDSNNDKDKK